LLSTSIFNLLARHGWAFTIVDQDGNTLAAASGTLPWWINGIYGAELWAILQGALVASPGSPLHVDCNAVRLGAQRGTSWALDSSRKLARAWIPLANILEDNPEGIAWVPAHCSSDAIGVRVLSNGRTFDNVDLEANAFVDTHAKREARAQAPSRSDYSVVNKATSLVEGLAKWIGMCTREANHFPAPSHTSGAKFIRDTTTRNSIFAAAKRALAKSVTGVGKRKAPSSVGVSSVATPPKIGRVDADAVVPKERFAMASVRDTFSRTKRPKLSHRQVEEKTNFVFMEYWLAQRELAPKSSLPPVSADDRKSDLLARVVARSSKESLMPGT
jgi:hypothetical protein